MKMRASGLVLRRDIPEMKRSNRGCPFRRISSIQLSILSSCHVWYGTSIMMLSAYRPSIIDYSRLTRVSRNSDSSAPAPVYAVLSPPCLVRLVPSWLLLAED